MKPQQMVKPENISVTVENIAKNQPHVIDLKNVDDISKDLLKIKPSYSPEPTKWIEKGGTIEVLEDGTWLYKDWNNNSIKYIDGFPDFKGGGFVRQEVDIGKFENYATDFKKADMLAPNGALDKINNTWHHHQDGKTLQEVNKIIHKEFTHRGGMSIKARSK